MSLDWYLLLAPLVLLPIALLPAFVGCSLFFEGPDPTAAPPDPSPTITEPLNYRIVIDELMISDRIATLRAIGDPASLAAATRLLSLYPTGQPFAGAGTVAASLFVDIVVTVSGAPSTSRDASTFSLTPVAGDDGTVVDWRLGPTRFPVLAQSFVADLPDPSLRTPATRVSFQITGGQQAFDIPGALFSGTVTYPVPADLSRIWTAFLTVLPNGLNVLSPNSGSLS